jgi:hypothetical protein
MTVADGSDDKSKPAGAKSLPQHEIDAQLAREKMARQRALRLAAEAGKPAVATPARRTAGKKTSAKSDAKARPLSEWLDAQEKEGRRN